MYLNSRRERIRRNQNDLLYAGIPFSAGGSALASCMVLVIFGPISGYSEAAGWFVLVSLVYGLRVLDLISYRRHREASSGCERVRAWQLRVSVGALASAAIWCSSLWIIYPSDMPAHEALLVLWLTGVSGGALATLPYDRHLANAFQLIIMMSVQARLWSDGSAFATELAVFSFFVFAFLMACGKEIAGNYHDLLVLRYDTQETNVALLQSTEEMARFGYWQWPLHSNAIELSGKLVEMLGFRTAHVRVTECYRLVHPADRARLRQSMEKVAALDEEVALEYRIKPRGENAYRYMKQVVKPVVDSRGSSLLLGTVQDVSDVKRAAERIYRLAFFDELTGLENRERFHEHLQHHVTMAATTGRSLAVIYIDLDDFKGINDSFGHEHADDYLKTVTRHLAGSVRWSDHVARMGGDEFAVLIHDIDDSALVERTVARILDLASRPVSIGPHRVQPRLSAGIALFPEHGRSPDKLLSCAAIAVEHVKTTGSKTAAYYAQEMEDTRLERARLEADLRRALESDEFELWYQPKIDIGIGRMTGVEALIRWRHPDQGLIPPGSFIEIAERIGMIADIGDWVLDAACRQQARWKTSGLEFTVAVNISSEHFTRPGFVSRVAGVLDANRLEGGDLEIEITESLCRDTAEHGRICLELRELGVRVAIDDFGTGYSSLSVLGDVAIDTIKIDRSFVTGLPDSARSRLMVDAMIGLASGLGYGIIAEGVETAGQLEYLHTSGCLDIQGFYFSKPVEAHRISLLAGRHWESVRRAA